MHFTVECALPISEAARSLVASGKINQVASLSLDLDGAIVDEVDVDLIVIDEAHHWAAALQVKRGNGATEPGKRRRIENGPFIVILDNNFTME